MTSWPTASGTCPVASLTSGSWKDVGGLRSIHLAKGPPLALELLGYNHDEEVIQEPSQALESYT